MSDKFVANSFPAMTLASNSVSYACKPFFGFHLLPDTIFAACLDSLAVFEFRQHPHPAPLVYHRPTVLQ